MVSALSSTKKARIARIRAKGRSAKYADRDGTVGGAFLPAPQSA
ncbi:hypothetical protein SF83666_c33320 [Sinorhizobium fredii CCBAU 83666]|nr:hypothetical protein SF83666_c33320 [Sinorhizobium fredii CCBAU 83666]